jgi:hypothetical protein
MHAANQEGVKCLDNTFQLLQWSYAEKVYLIRSLSVFLRRF